MTVLIIALIITGIICAFIVLPTQTWEAMGNWCLAFARRSKQRKICLLYTSSIKLRHQILSGTHRAPGVTRISPVDSVEHVAQLRRGNRHHTVTRRWPDAVSYTHLRMIT